MKKPETGSTAAKDVLSISADPGSFRARLRADILTIALGIMTREGLGAVQARRVALDAGCSVGTIYNIFGGLDGLIIAVNSETLDLMGGELRAVYEATQELSTPERLTALALAYMNFAFSHHARWSAIFEHRLPPGKSLPEDYDASRAELLALLARAIGSGPAKPDERLRAARSLFAATHGIITLALDNKMSPFDPAVVEADIRFIVTAAARGLDEAVRN